MVTCSIQIPGQYRAGHGRFRPNHNQFIRYLQITLLDAIWDITSFSSFRVNRRFGETPVHIQLLPTSC
jgi:hypothetical protein